MSVFFLSSLKKRNEFRFIPLFLVAGFFFLSSLEKGGKCRFIPLFSRWFLQDISPQCKKGIHGLMIQL